LDSAPDDRWDTFARCYNRLYSALPWLADTGGDPDGNLWSSLIGDSGSRIYEVGSGAGRLATALADSGYIVTATDVSRQRGGARDAVSNLEWAMTDGVHLDRFAEPGTFDAVLSNQVVEHLHPDDLEEHLRSARSLLKPGGRYVLCTPHVLTGPHDVSKVFGLDSAVGMHLHEYTNSEVARALGAAGFSRVSSVLYSPKLWRRPFASRLHLYVVIAIEHLLLRVERGRARAVASRLRGPLRLEVFLIAQR
jgi:2-polyprenyl-3-methyl-5-hydroxy-6-metoxy-1,4-benzoquinol methylase